MTDLADAAASKLKAAAATHPLLLKRVAIDTFPENVAYLHRECEVYRTEGFRALSRIEISSDGQRLTASLNVVADSRLVAPHELGLSEQAFARFGCAEQTPIRVTHAQPAESMQAVRRKIAGERLNAADYDSIVRDVTNNRYSKMELAAFLVAADQADMDRDEILYLTEAMVRSGNRLDWREKPVVDKHCIGGIPGNRTSMLVVPIVAAHGMLIPKTSSRSITSPAGTADTMEVLADVELPIERLTEIVRELRGCIAWGGKARLSPADDVLISVERPLAIDSPGQMVASILSKKAAAGSTHLIIDVPVGPTAKVRHMRDAQRLRKLFEYIGGHMGLTVDVVITDGRQPIGHGIGPVLEARDVMAVLQNDPNAPNDLRQKAIRLAGRVLEFDPDIRGGDGFAIARDILDSGRALAKMNAIIDAQGRQPRAIAPGSLTHEVCAQADGVVAGIDNLQLARIARYSGAPMAKGAGVDLLKKLGDHVSAGEPLYRIHAEVAPELAFAQALAASNSGYTIGRAEDIPRAFVEF